MSWLSQNYEKASLGGAVVIALGLAFFGWSKVNGVEEGFASQLKGSGNDDPSVKDADLIPKAVASLAAEHRWAQAEDEGRPVDLFTGIPLFVGIADPLKPIDLVDGDSVHPPIPNTWWIANRIDPGFADSPARDPDDDGFTNLEEFKGKTDPNSIKSHPHLIAKLKYLRDDSLTWVLRPGFESDGGFTFEFSSAKGNNKVSGGNVVMRGSLFFTDGVMKNRFKLVGSETREVLNASTNSTQPVTFVSVEDQRPNKMGTMYEIPSSFPRDRAPEHAKHDRSAVFSLEALGLKGQEFTVEENTTFALPTDGAKKDYLAKVVTPDSVTVEYTDASGARKTVDIPKGSMPGM